MAEPHHLIYWLFIGLVAGAVASRVVHGKGHGCIADTVVGIAGAFIGGFVFRQIAPSTAVIDGMLDELVVAFLGAVLLLALVRLVSPRRGRP